MATSVTERKLKWPATRTNPCRRLSSVGTVDFNLSSDELGRIGLAHAGEGARIDRRVAFFNPGSIWLGDHVRIDAFSVLAGGAEELRLGSYVHIGAACYL